jgi:hypothetical protein
LYDDALAFTDTLGLVYAVARKTVFRHFCAGETLSEAMLTLQQNKLKSILFFSIESSHNNSQFFDMVRRRSNQLTGSVR